MLGHIVATRLHLAHLGQAVGVDLDDGAHSACIGFRSDEVNRHPCRTIDIGIAQYLGMIGIAVSNDIRYAVLVEVQPPQAVELELFIRPILRHVLELGTRTQVHVQVVVVGVRVGEPVGGHHHIIPPVTIDVNGTRSPTVLEAGHSCGVCNVHIYTVVVPEEGIGVVFNVGDILVPIPIVVGVEQRGGHGLDANVCAGFSRDVNEIPVTSVAVEGIRENGPVIDDPQIIKTVAVKVHPSPLERVLVSVAHT